MHNYNGKESLCAKFFVIKFVTTLPEKKKRFENTCALSILIKVRAEGKCEIVKYTDFVKNRDFKMEFFVCF